MFRQRFFDANGNPLAGGKLYSYIAATTTPQATYSNSTGTTNANPVVLDANGEADMWLNPSLAYKFILKDSNNVVQWTVDNVAGGLYTDFVGDSGSGGQSGLVPAPAAGDAAAGKFLMANGDWELPSNTPGNVTTVTSNTAIATTDNFVRSNSTSGSLSHSLPSPATAAVGKEITVKDVGTGGNTTTVTGTGTELPKTLAALLALTFKNNGTGWDII